MQSLSISNVLCAGGIIAIQGHARHLADSHNKYTPSTSLASATMFKSKQSACCLKLLIAAKWLAHTLDVRPVIYTRCLEGLQQSWWCWPNGAQQSCCFLCNG